MPDLSALSHASCVLGTLPEALKRAIVLAFSTGSDSVIAYLCTALPREDEDTDAHIARSAVTLSTVAPRFAVFSDASSRRRWTVELGLSDTLQGTGMLAGAWQADAKDAVALGLDVAAGAQAAPGNVAITAPRYCMLSTTWREAAVPVSRPPTKPAAVAASVSGVMASPHAASKHTADNANTPKGEASDSVPTPTPPPAPSSPAANTTLSAASRAAAASPLHGVSLQNLVEQHAALVRRLVQALAPQRQSAAQVIRAVCTTASIENAPLGTSAAAPRVCEVEAGATADTSNANAFQQYTEADVAAAIAVLTTPHPRQPQLRELCSEGFLLIDVDGFADGAARHKAVNRAYPAVALHWPSSAGLMDAMERYVDRDVVLDTRKRHPELMQTSPKSHAAGPHKRTRSSSASSGTSSRAESEEAAESAVQAPSAHASTPLSRAAPTASPMSTPSPAPTAARLFHTLREYPQSLEPGDLRAWAASAAAQQVRECVTAAMVLSEGLPASHSLRTPPAGGAAAETSAPAWSGLPVANSDDVVVLRGQYDGLAAGETVLVSRLRAYAETVQELRGWYRADLCAPSFQVELAAWVAGQEECRAALTDLLTRVHVLRYRLERDLADFFHLHALGVV